MDGVYFLSVDDLKEINSRQVEYTKEPFDVLKPNELEGITRSPQVSLGGRVCLFFNRNGCLLFS